jgi:hypothetical protein
VQERDKEDRASLISYICELYKLEYPTGMILKQIKNYIEVNKYKYKGIELALKFFYEIQDNPVNFDGGIGIVQYCYEAAKQDYIKRMKIAESIDNLQPNEEITVYIDLSATKRKSKKIDIANI